jgi:PAS domain S-box-containing protein
MSKNPNYFLNNGGEMGELLRAKDWSKTPLGSPETWPQPLQTVVALVLNNPFAMYIAWGKEYTQIYNDGFLPILGTLKHPNAVGGSANETFIEVCPVLKPIISNVMNGKAIYLSDFALCLNRNGYSENCYFDLSYSPIYLDDGKVGGVLVTVTETTINKLAQNKLKESEERFKAMADNIPNLAWMASGDGSIYWYNSKWYEYTGTTAEQMIGWGWQTIYNEQELAPILKEWNSSLKAGISFEMIIPMKRADGIYHQFLTRALPLKNEEGEITTWFGTNTDITAQKVAEEALSQSKKELEFVIEAAKLGTFDYDPTTTTKFSANKRLKDWFIYR